MLYALTVMKILANFYVTSIGFQLDFLENRQHETLLFPYLSKLRVIYLL